MLENPLGASQINHTPVCSSGRHLRCRRGKKLVVRQKVTSVLRFKWLNIRICFQRKLGITLGKRSLSSLKVLRVFSFIRRCTIKKFNVYLSYNFLESPCSSSIREVINQCQGLLDIRTHVYIVCRCVYAYIFCFRNNVNVLLSWMKISLKRSKSDIKF